MKLLIFCSVLLSVGLALAKPQFRPATVAAPFAVSNLAPYEFNYKVEHPPTNTFFGQNENGDANGNKVGTYYVLLPDGRTLTVNYVADAYGYNPKISFQGGRPNF